MIAPANTKLQELRADRLALEHELKLLGAQIHGNSCRCVFHDDQSASGGIYRRENGAWAFKCNASTCNINFDVVDLRARRQGVSAADILRGLRDETGGNGSNPHRHNGNGALQSSNGNGQAKPKKIYRTSDELIQARPGTIAYQYTDPDTGRVDLIVIRENLPDGGKRIQQAGPCEGGYCYGKPAGVQPIYNRSRLRAAESIIVVEGEKAVHALAEIDVVATTSPMGAGKAAQADWSPMRGKTAFLWPDNDAPGQTHMADVAVILRGLGCAVKWIDVPAMQLPPKGDAVEWLASMERDDAADIARAVDGIVAGAIDNPWWTTKDVAETTPEGPLKNEVRVSDTPLHVQAKLCSDIGNAARFATQYRGKAIYCEGIGWFIWNGQQWKQDKIGKIMRLAKDTALGIYVEARDDENHQEQLTKWALKSQSADKLRSMLALAQCELAIMADELDADPDLLNTPGGIVNLQTSAVKPHDPAKLLTKITLGSYRPGATAPHFMACLARTFRTHPALISYIQRVAGYCATGHTKEQCLLFLYGKGANGKTTLIDGIAHPLNDYAGKADRELLNAGDHGPQHPANIADLHGKRLVVLSETNEGKRIDEAKLKDLVGERRINARHMYGKFFEFTASHKIVMYSNHRPVVRGTDHGFWRRMRVVPFVETIGEEEKDPSLPEKLQAEADGIVTWIIDGAAAWYREGLQPLAEVTEATADYRREQDTIGSFLEECTRSTANSEVMAREIYAAYQRWCEDAGERALSQNRLGAALADKGFEKGRDSYTGRATWREIALKGSEPINDVY